jgi:parallel beta-helix repeat protein
MLRTSLFLSAAIALATLAVPAAPAHAAESYDACTGFITAVGQTISTPGVWCMNKNLATAGTAGSAITVNANNVVIDCNDYKLDGMSGGVATTAYGISGSNRINVTVRNCSVLGFQQGIRLAGTGGGHVVEDNRVDSSTYVGILMSGDGSTVRRNQLINIGGSTIKPTAYGISTTGVHDVIDNTVSGVIATIGTESNAYGIYTTGNAGGSVNGNRVRNVLHSGGTRAAYGIYSTPAARMTLRNNDLSSDTSLGTVGIRCGSTGNRVRNSTVSGFATGLSGCGDAGGNDVN